MKAQVLGRQLVLEGPERVADGAGGYVTDWAPLGTLWAKVTAWTGHEGQGALAPVSRLRVRIMVRAAPHGAPSRPRAGQRFREGARVFAILAVSEADGAGRYLVCQAQEEIAP